MLFLVFISSLVISQDPAVKPKREYLIQVSAGKTTNDKNPDDQPAPKIVDEPAVGGKGLKVTFLAGGSVGQRVRIVDWSKFERLRFKALNPGADTTLELNILHAGSTDFDTRVVVPISLKKGKNDVVVELGELKNTNGSDPELAQVKRWYIAATEEETPTVIFGDLQLESGTTKDEPKETPAPNEGNAPAFKVRINQERVDRIKAAKMPKFTKPVPFDAPEAAKILDALEIFPADNPWNTPVDDWPVHPNSQAIIASVGEAKPLRYNPDMGFVLVPPNQKSVEVKLNDNVEESDPGPYPLPDSVLIEGWPAFFKRDPDLKKLKLDDVQRGQPNLENDRHGIIVDPVNRKLYEFYRLTKTDDGWQADQASIFDLASNKLRPDEWTSADAAGLPIFPSIVRHDELKRGNIEHALRVTIAKTRHAYVYPATHFASDDDSEELPRMGERFRLKKDFNTSKFSAEVKVILEALKVYGMMNADNGIDWAISVAPDARIPVMHDELRKVKGSDFEVVTPPEGYAPPE
ncbi:MAG: hypothetical protein V4719_32030 [Planctomycetota bacterium]